MTSGLASSHPRIDLGTKSARRRPSAATVWATNIEAAKHAARRASDCARRRAGHQGDAGDSDRLDERLDEVDALGRVAPRSDGLAAEPTDEADIDDVDEVHDDEGQHRGPGHRPDVAIDLPTTCADREGRGVPGAIDGAAHARTFGNVPPLKARRTLAEAPGPRSRESHGFRPEVTEVRPAVVSRGRPGGPMSGVSRLSIAPVDVALAWHSRVCRCCSAGAPPSSAPWSSSSSTDASCPAGAIGGGGSAAAAKRDATSGAVYGRCGRLVSAPSAPRRAAARRSRRVPGARIARIFRAASRAAPASPAA